MTLSRSPALVFGVRESVVDAAVAATAEVARNERRFMGLVSVRELAGSRQRLGGRFHGKRRSSLSRPINSIWGSAVRRSSYQC